MPFTGLTAYKPFSSTTTLTQLYSKFVSITDENKPNNPKQIIKDKWNILPGGTFLLIINCGTVYGAIVQKVNSSFGSAIIFGYAADAIVFIRKNNTNWLE